MGRPFSMRIPFLSEALTTCVLAGCVAAIAFLHPATPLPPAWNPTIPLKVSHDYSPFTRWKANRAGASLDSCITALDTFEGASLPPLVESDLCGISDRVRLKRVGGAALDSVETHCSVALRLALWERHDLQALAKETLGTAVTGLEHFSSFSCRRIRTAGGEGSQMSSHATGTAIDISGFDLSDGRTLTLRSDWDGEPDARAFLRGAQRSACRWFGGVLGPDYNALHADHFHLQVGGRGFCW